MYHFKRLALWVLILANVACSNPEEDIKEITLPEGFRIGIFAEDVKGARSMTRGDEGTIFVGTRHSGNVYALQDTDGDNKIDKQYTLMSDLFMPNGVAYRNGDLYVAEVNKVWRLPDIENSLDNPNPELLYDNLPDEKSHGWKYIAFGPDDKLYIPIGAPCNVCERDDERYATINRINPDGSGFEIYARGVRNSVGFDWHPETGELWFTDNGRDWMGDDIPPDELNHAPQPGLHFGFPYWHGSGVKDPEFGDKMALEEVTKPVQDLGPHVAALGMNFYDGDMFPPEYRHQVFIAEHGSWNRTEPIGYRVTLVRLDDEGNSLGYEVFAEGWLKEDGTVIGRPVDVFEMPDGSLLVSDDYASLIYRIWYEGS